MANVCHLADIRRRQGFVHFTRSEMNTLLGLYARFVAVGEWRDYAIAMGQERAVFSVYRSAYDRPPLFTMIKYAEGSHRQGDFQLLMGGQPFKRARTLDSLLAHLGRPRGKRLAAVP